MAEPIKKRSSSHLSSPAKSAKDSTHAELSAIVDSCLEKQSLFFQPQFSRLEETGKSLDAKLDVIQSNFTKLLASMHEVRTELSGLRTQVSDHEIAISRSDAKVESLEAKLADLEDRSRRGNVRIVGLEEGLEGSDATAYLTRSIPLWFPSLVGRQLEIMRAHRIYANKRSGSAFPRTVVVNFLRHSDRDVVLQAARKQPLSLSGRAVKIFPDFSNFTAQRRKGFSGIIRSVRSMGLQAFLLYPASLKILQGNEAHLFKTPDAAEVFLNSLGRSGGARDVRPPSSCSVRLDFGEAQSQVVLDPDLG